MAVCNFSLSNEFRKSTKTSPYREDKKGHRYLQLMRAIPNSVTFDRSKASNFTSSSYPSLSRCHDVIAKLSFCGPNRVVLRKRVPRVWNGQDTAEDGVSRWESIELLPRLPRETRIPGFHVATPKNSIYESARPVHLPRSTTTPSVLLEAPHYLWTRGLRVWKERSTTEERERRAALQGRDRKRGRRKEVERATQRAEYNGPRRRFGNVGTRHSEWETNEESAPTGSQDNAFGKTNVNVDDNAAR